MELTQESRKRNVAYRVRIGDLLKTKPVIEEGRLLFLEVGDKKVVRVNIIANCVDKFVQEGEKKYASITLDDATGQIRIKVFGDDINLLKDVAQGDTLGVVGTLREWNDEIYIIPEIIKKIDPKWLLVRKLELQERGLVKETENGLRDKIIQKIREAESEGGIDTERLILEIASNPIKINEEIKSLIEQGIIYEPRPGRLRWLG